MKKLLMILPVLSLLAGCDFPDDSTSKERKQQEVLSRQSVNEVGMPAIINFQEKRMMKQILELRDTTISTITYIVDMNGKLHKVCDSVGYGLPYATQYTNPQKRDNNVYEHDLVLPQADPSGLYSPSSANGTWVLCLDTDKKKSTPVYIEPNVIVSPYALKID